MSDQGTGTAGDGSADDSVRAFRIAFDVGVTVTKWTRLWQQRRPDIPLEVFRSEPGRQTAVLHSGVADVSFVRHPFDRTAVSAIELYSEKPVVGVPREHPASVFDEVPVAELADEHLLQPPDDVPEWRDVATEVADGSRQELRGIQNLDDAVEQVAAGVGIVILPHAVARLHSRKDVVYRPVTGVAETPVSLVWVEGDPSPLVEQFIGIVRGRSESSSRGPVDARGGGATSGASSAKKLGPVAKAKAKARAAEAAAGGGSAKVGGGRGGGATGGGAAGGKSSGAKHGGASGKPGSARKKTQSELVNKAQARKRKFGGKR